MSQPQAVYADRAYRVLCADPPWYLDDQLPGPGRGAAKHYSCLTLHQIVTFPLPQLEADSVLFLWRLASMMSEALLVCKAWGFTPKAELVWLKRTRFGKRHMGMGRIVRNEHEVCLIATRGKPKVLTHSMRSTFCAGVGVHSQKPAKAYEIMEQLYDGPRAELFARQRRVGWQAYGDEVGILAAANDNGVPL